RMEGIMRSESNNQDEHQSHNFDQLPFPPLEPEREFATPEETDMPREDALDQFKDTWMGQTTTPQQRNPFAPSHESSSNPFAAGRGQSAPSPFQARAIQESSHRNRPQLNVNENKLVEGLNPQQVEAVQHTGSPLLIIA